MVSIPLWLETNWLNIIQSAGIIGGLLFTAFTFRRDAKGRRASDLLALAEQHRDIWSEVYRKPELRRINHAEVDLISSRVTPEEEEFLNLVFVHAFTTWLLAESGTLPLLSLKTLALDIGTFLKKPIPLAVWKSSKDTRDPRFVKFVDECIQRAAAVSAK